MSSNEDSKDKKKAQGGEIARLESLSRTRTPLSMTGSRPSSASGSTRGRFMPKTVARRSKEERQASAPVEPVASRKSATSRPRGGRSSTRGGRHDNVSTIAVGPLAAPSQSAPKATGARGLAMAMNINAFEGNYVKNEPGRSGTSSIESTPGPHFENRIDMSSSKALPNNNIALFPVRLDRDETPELTDDSNKANVASDDILSQEFSKLDMDYKELTKSIFEHSTPSVDTVMEEEVKVKQENSEEIQIESKPIPEETNNLFFMQLPMTIPKFKIASDGKSKKNKEETIVVDEEMEQDEETNGFSHEGRIGTIRRHKSGKLTMKIGDMILDMSRGTECNYLQDVVAHNIPNQSSYLLGQLTQRVIFTPQLDQLEL